MHIHLKNLEEKDYDVSKIDRIILKETFALVEAGNITKEAISDVLVGLINGDTSPKETARKLNLIMLSEQEVEDLIDVLISENKKMIEDRGMGAMGALMGKSMQKLQGKADGKLVNKLLKDKIQNIK